MARVALGTAMPMQDSSPGHSQLRLAAVACLNAIAAWGMLSLGFTSALNPRLPFAAQAIYGGDPMTRLQIAQASEAKTESPIVAIDQAAAPVTRATARMALLAEPLNGEVFRQLARTANQAGEPLVAKAYLLESFRRNFRQTDVSAQLLQASLVAADYAGAVRYSDALLRTDVALLPAVVPVLMAIGDDAKARRFIIDAIRSNPPWRSAFLDQYGKSTHNEDAYWDMFVALRNTTGALRPAEISPFLYALLERDHVDRALSIWLMSLPEAMADNMPLLFNGDFKLPTNDSPFNWALLRPAGATVGVASVPGEGDKKALRIEFADRRADIMLAQQWTALTPGRYRVSGRFKPDEFRNSRGLTWRVYCGYSAPRLEAESPRLNSERASWRTFQFEFNIPTDKCSAQLVRLELAARIPQEQLASGVAWFDNLKIENLP